MGLESNNLKKQFFQFVEKFPYQNSKFNLKNYKCANPFFLWVKSTILTIIIEKGKIIVDYRRAQIKDKF